MFITSAFRKQKGSALLIVLFLSSFLLVIFASFSGEVRNALKRQNQSSTNQSVTFDDHAEATRAYGVTSISSEYTLNNSTSGIVAYSGGTTNVKWVNSGAVLLTLTEWATAYYEGADGGTTFTGYVSTSVPASLNLASASGTFNVRSLGGFSKITPNTSAIISNTQIVQISKQIGNKILPVTQFYVTP